MKDRTLQVGIAGTIYTERPRYRYPPCPFAS
jgi:hypothetical protein